MTEELRAPDDCTVRIDAGGRTTRGVIVGIEGLEVVLSAKAELPDTHSATITIELWFILEALRDRLAAIAAEGPFAAPLFTQAGPGEKPTAGPSAELISRMPEALNPEQRHGAALAQTDGAHFIWGPPGTGKTRTIGFGSALAAPSRRILLLAYSNSAVDVATLAVDYGFQSSGPSEPGRVFRCGSSLSDKIRNSPHLSALGAFRREHPAEARRLADLQQQHRQLVRDGSRDTRRLKKIREGLRELQQRVQEYEEYLVRRARVVSCTLAKLATWPALADVRFDTVILDEASMAPLPYAALAASHGEKTVVYTGDFRQLPPIVVSNSRDAQEVLGVSAFDHAGVTGADAVQQSDPRMVMLQVQYRMHPNISQHISAGWYGGKLRDGPEVLQRAAPIAASPPLRGRSVVVADIAPLRSEAIPGPADLGGSRFNLVSALAAIGLAAEAAAVEGRSVGVIAPYRLQAQITGRLLRAVGLDRVRTSTVHRFQGEELDVIIFDLTTAGNHKPRGFLGGDVYSNAGRLLNVALSRARGKLIVLGDLEQVEKKFEPNDAVRAVLTRMDAQRLTPDLLKGFFRRLGDGARQPPIEILDGQVFGSQPESVGKPASQLVIAVRDGAEPPIWLTAMAKRGIQVAVSGPTLHPGWKQVPGVKTSPQNNQVNAVYSRPGTLSVDCPHLASFAKLSIPDGDALEFIAVRLGLDPALVRHRSYPVSAKPESMRTH